MARTKKVKEEVKDAPVEVIKINIERKPKSWTEKNNEIQAQLRGEVEKNE